MTNSVEVEQQSLNEIALIFQPRLLAELHTPVLLGFRPFLGWGYTFVRSQELSLTTPTPSTASFSYGGFNFNTGLSFDIDDFWFLILQYDNIKLKNGSAPTEDISGKKMTLLKFSLGRRF